MLARAGALVLALALAVGPPAAWAQDDPPGTETDTQRPPSIGDSEGILLNGTYTVKQLVEYFAEMLDHNYVLEGGDRSLGEEVRIISHQRVSPRVAEQAFIAALEVSGYTVIDVQGAKQIIKSSEAVQNPVLIGMGDDLPAWDARYVTQIIQLEGVKVSEVNSVVTTLASADAKVIAYQPTNTLIITDTVPNLRKIQRVLSELDVSSPKSRLEIIRLDFADADEVASLIEELYGVGEEVEEDDDPRARRRRVRRRRRRARRDQPEDAEAVTAGESSTFISKIISDERTNSLIVLANDNGFEAIYDLLDEIDIAATVSRSQIHVVYLQHAKAEDVASVLSNLSEGGQTEQDARRRPRARRGQDEEPEEDEGSGVLAAFDSGMRITHDENTNSLVVIADPEDFTVISSVIERLDVRRKQVFVDAVILEIGSDNSSEVGLAYHGPADVGENAVGFWGGQLGASSLGLTQDLLSGLAVGVFGESIEVPFSSGQGTSVLEVPAFGIVLSALKSNSLVNIVSNPNLLTLDNEEAKIVVGRQIPFPTSSGLNSLGQPVVSYQREDVATELSIVPRINSKDEVTLEITATVSEIEEDNQGLDVNQAGFITSKREIETVALVKDNQTMVLGGLVGVTDTEVETKVPILGDLPILGALFRGRRAQARRANLMIFLTPHIIDNAEDMIEVQRIKEAQRQEFLRRFYGQSRDKQVEEMKSLLSYSMNMVDGPTMYRGSIDTEGVSVEGEDLSDETRRALEDTLEESRGDEPGEGAGELDEDDEGPIIVVPSQSENADEPTDEDLAVPAGSENDESEE